MHIHLNESKRITDVKLLLLRNNSRNHLILCNALMNRVFANDPGDRCSIPYQRLKKWYLMPPSLTLSIIRWVSRVKWSNPGKGVAPSSTSRCGSY